VVGAASGEDERPMTASTVVTVIGDLLEDVVVWTAGPVVVGTDNPAVVRRSRGGSGANVAAAVAGAGATARFVGRVGADPAGDALVAQLAGAGVDVRVQRGGRTGCVVVLVDERGERTMFPDRAASSTLGPILPDDLAGTTVLHVPLYGLAVPGAGAPILDAVAHVRRSGGRLSLDLSASSVIERLGRPAIVALIEDLRPALVFANAVEAAVAGLTGAVPPPGVTYVVKDGGRPAVITTDGGTTIAVPPEPIVDVQDTTGAGDAFAGAFLATWSRDANLRHAGAHGHRAAAAVLSVPGADPRPPIPRSRS
jgi:sugar/nucleoside kinase (ribokinase family)